MGHYMGHMKNNTLKKIMMGMVMFPWTLLIAALPLLDKLAHSMGVCIGS